MCHDFLRDFHISVELMNVGCPLLITQVIPATWNAPYVLEFEIVSVQAPN